MTMRSTAICALFFASSSLAAQVDFESMPAPRSVLVSSAAETTSHVPAPILLPAEDRTAEFIVNYSGFSAEAQTAFQYAVDIWAGLITSDVPIVIDAQWEDLPGSTLGSAGATGLWYNFSGAPFSSILYPSPLADKLAGFNLEPGAADISANFDSGTNWYYGLDGNTPFSQFDLVSVVLHEIGHGLGFAGTVYVGVDGNGYVLNGSLSGIFDNYVWTGNNESVLSFGDGSSALGAALVSDNLYWAGVQGNAYSGDFSPKMYAPAFWEPGSSFSHFDEDTYPAGSDHALMTPAIGNGEAVHSPGAMALGVLEDIGWTVDYAALGGGTPGCTDETACNYDPAATLEDGSCIYPFADEPCGDCTAVWSMSADLSAGQGASFEFDGVGSVGNIEVAVQWPGQSGGGEWISDLLIEICDPEGDCFEWGGYDMTAGAMDAGVDWPASWEDGTAGSYTAAFDLTALGLSGTGTWTVSLYNGYSESSGLALTDVTLTLPYICPLVDLGSGCTDEMACNYDPAAVVDDGSCFTPFDFGWCDCDGSVFDALGECGGDCAEDADSDGICDTEDPCIGGDIDECGVCDGPGAVYECGCSDIPAGDCDCDGNQLDALGVCGGDCESDLDMDGVCDIPGCTDMTACNYEASANYDDGSCTYAEAYYDCAGNCLNDADGDGVCDELEVDGCTDSNACNFEADATEEDGSCAYLTATSIDGDEVVDEGDVTLYVAQPSEPGNTYTWAVSGGSLESGQGSPIVTVAWSDVGSQGIQLVESNSDCTGEVLSLEVAVQEVVNVEELGKESGTVYPNPAVSGFHISNPTGEVLLMGLDGRRVQSWSAEVRGGWYRLQQGVTSGVYLLQFEAGGVLHSRRLIVEGY